MKNIDGLSIIAPFYNEDKNVALLYEEIMAAIEALPYSVEIIFINDGSSDNTKIEINKLAVKSISTQKRTGQSSAIISGMKQSKFNIIITIDGDLQNNPRDIPLLVNQYKASNYDLIIGKRVHRLDSRWKKIQSSFGNLIIKLIFKSNASDIGCGLKIFDKNLVFSMPQIPRFHRYISVLFHLNKLLIGEVRIGHRKRTSGKSKYGLSRNFTFFIDVIKLFVYKNQIKNTLSE